MKAMISTLFAFVLLSCSFALLTPSTTGAAPVVQVNEVVDFRCQKWLTKHVHDAKKATKIADTMKKLGIETQVSNHGGHIDLKYRCPKWRQLKLKTHKEAHTWMNWLKEYGFEVKHEH